MQSYTYNDITFYRTNNDINGNPRYIVHFLDLVTEEENDKYTVLELVEIAKTRANKLGGKKYRGKDFGGGFVFQCYSIRELSRDINGMLNK